MIQNIERLARLCALQSGERSSNPMSSPIFVPTNAHKLFQLQNC